MQMHEHVLSFKIPNQDSGEVWLDVAFAMSMVNRKLYRQQGLWHLHGVCTYAESDYVPAHGGGTTGVPYTVSLSGAPRTWVTRNALVKGFEAWKDQQKLAYDASSPSLKPKWQDFKVWLNKAHKDSGVHGLTPVSGHMFGGTDDYMVGEWKKAELIWEDVDSTVVPPTITKHETQLHIMGVGNGFTNVSLIEQYAKSRSRVQSPDPAHLAAIEGNIYTRSEEAIDERVMGIVENLGDDNDNPPYDVDSYPAGPTNGNEPILYAFGANASTGKRKLTLNGFAAPNGLIEVQFAKETIFDEDGNPITVPNTGELWIQLFVSHREAY